MGPTLRLALRLGPALRHAEAAELWPQAHAATNRAAPYVCLTMAFVGGILVLQAGDQVRHLVGDAGLVGPALLPLLVQEFAPVLTGLLMAARNGAGVAAELGAMAVGEQLEALRLCGTDPLRHLVAPRVLAGALGGLPLTVLGAASAYGAGALVARRRFGLAWHTFAGLQLTGPRDLWLGALKAVLFGALVPLVGAAAGLGARRGAAAVGQATTAAVIGGSVAVLAADLLVGLAAWALWP